MRSGRTPIVWLATLCAIATPATAQPFPTDTGQATRPSGDTKIPIEGPISTEVLSAEGSGTTTTPAPTSLEGPINPDEYVCGPGDIFELNFWGQQNFRLRIAVDLEGRTFISKVGFVAVAGKSLTAVRGEIRKKVRTNYPGLQFDLTLTNPRSFVVHVVDNVKQPGTFTAHPIERVSAVVARAGGTTGSRRQIAIRHRDGSETVADLVMYEMTGDTKYNPYLLDGDVIRVPFARIVVSIDGGVRRPGTYELIKTHDLTEVLDLAGGLSGGAAKTLPIRVVHKNAKQQDVFVDVPITGESAKNVPLQDQDKIEVPTVESLQRTVLVIGAVVGADPLDTATTSKRIPYIEGDTVLSLINRAGGIKAPGDLARSFISRPQTGKSPLILPIDLDALIVRRDFNADKPIQMNDTIVIPPMRYGVLVEGAVSRRGLYTFNPTFGITEYIAQAGGRLRTAEDLDEVRLVDAKGTSHGFSKSLKPSPGDSILVPERDFTRAEVAQLILAGAGLVLSGIAVTLAATR
jgi:protein involved in polysaccharide export with SLBB domain